MSLKEDLTVIFVSYLSKNLIEKPIKQINSNIPIIVVENSNVGQPYNRWSFATIQSQKNY